MIWVSSACPAGLHVAARLAASVGVRLYAPRARLADARNAIVALIGQDPGRRLDVLVDDGAPDAEGVEELWHLVQAAQGDDLERETRQAGIAYRRFVLDWVAEPPDAIAAGPFSTFMLALDRTVCEVRRKDPDYFERHALRTSLAADLTVLAATTAASGIVAASAEASRSCRVAARASGGACALADAIADAYELDLILGADPATLSAVDRLFESRLGDLASRSARPVDEPVRWAEPIGGDELAKLIAAWRDRQAASRSAERPHGIETSAAGTAAATGSARGSHRLYGREGPLVVIVNAIAQDLRYWTRLLDRLIDGHRVLLWAPPALGEGGAPTTFEEQSRALEAVVAEVTDGAVHLVGWCTGPKLCARYCLTHPGRVLSMVFLTGTYRPFGDSSLDTIYETTLEMVFRLLDRSPSMADTVRTTLLDAVNSGRSKAMRPTDPGAEALSRLDAQLVPSVLAPYATSESTLRYASQIRDFWNHSIESEVRAIQAPVLVVGAEFDWVAASRMGQRVAQHLPNGRFVELPGATHWCMYDRPDDVAALIARFVDEQSRSPLRTEAGP